MCIMKTLRNIAEFLMILFKRSSHIFKSGISQIFFKFEFLYLSSYDENKHRINFSSTIQLTTFIECKKFYEKDAWLSGRASSKFNLHKSDDKHQRKVFTL